jgi:two-component system, chemotaxis family, CheB/CheR fusion protein
MTKKALRKSDAGSESADTRHEEPVVIPRCVVGIGASAGGLDPLVRFFENLPKDTGMAFVIVQHLSPDFKSLMDELLARHTPLPIHLVEDGMPVEADHIYLIPAKKEMIVSGLHEWSVGKGHACVSGIAKPENERI